MSSTVAREYGMLNLLARVGTKLTIVRNSIKNLFINKIRPNNTLVNGDLRVTNDMVIAKNMFVVPTTDITPRFNIYTIVNAENLHFVSGSLIIFSDDSRDMIVGPTGDEEITSVDHAGFIEMVVEYTISNFDQLTSGETIDIVTPTYTNANGGVIEGPIAISDDSALMRFNFGLDKITEFPNIIGNLSFTTTDSNAQLTVKGYVRVVAI